MLHVAQRNRTYNTLSLVGSHRWTSSALSHRFSVGIGCAAKKGRMRETGTSDGSSLGVVRILFISTFYPRW